MTLPRLRESLTLVLLALLPFHAFLVTVLTKLILGPDHPPMAILAVWKEALLASILIIAVLESMVRMCSRHDRERILRLDAIDCVIVALFVIALALLATPRSSLPVFLFGMKYDFIPLFAFTILRRVSWSDDFRIYIRKIFLIDAAIIALYGIVTLLLPYGVFRIFGYSDLPSLYLPDRPIAAFQFIQGIALKRMQSTFSGPNQLGLWLLLPLSFLLSSMLSGKNSSKNIRRVSSLLFVLILIALFESYSRAAWISAIVIVLVPWIRQAKHKLRIFVTSGLAFLLLSACLVFLFPSVIERIGSSKDHFLRPIEAIEIMKAHPLGLGLGSAGPASNRFADACVLLNTGDDPSWAKDRPELCVFVGKTQVQPLHRTCSCALLTENWYLQIGVELGVIGFVLYAVLTLLLLKRLWKTQEPILLAFLGLSIAALFLHAFEDSAVAYSIWILLALSISRYQEAGVHR